MTSRSRYMARAGHRYIGTDRSGEISVASDFEFEESDVWGGSGYSSSNLTGSPPDIITRRQPPPRKIGSGCSRKQHQLSSRNTTATIGVPSSLPVNIPDWSRILREESRESQRRSEFGSYCEGEDEYEVEEDEFGNSGGGGGVRVPPHEMVARKQRMASFSVYEGVGRTLKGRDLSRVRNAIWAKTGFQD